MVYTRICLSWSRSWAIVFSSTRPTRYRVVKTHPILVSITVMKTMTKNNFGMKRFISLLNLQSIMREFRVGAKYRNLEAETETEVIGECC